MKKVMVFGTFDTLHRGHLYFLRNAAALGDTLIAVVARDKTVGELKGITPMHSYNDRVAHLLKTGIVKKALPSDEERGSWQVLQKERPQVICLGHDQDRMGDNLRSWLERQKDYSPEIQILPPYKRNVYSSTAERKRRSILFYALLVLSMTIMALSWVSGKIVSAEAPFPVLIFWRFLFSLLPFLPFPPHRDRLSLTPKAAGYALLSALFLLFYNVFFFTGLSIGMAGKGGVIVTTLNPLITTAVIILAGRRKPEKSMVLGLLLGFAGGLVLLEPQLAGGVLFRRDSAFFLAAAGCWSFMTVFSGKAQEHINLKMYNFYLYLFAAFGSLIMALPYGPFRLSGFTGSFWVNILFLSFFVSSLATSLYFRAAAKIGPPKASAFTFLIPLLALLLSWIILGETPRLLTIGGAVLSLTALYFINKKAPRRDYEQNT